MANYVDERGNRVDESDTHKKVETTAVKARQGFKGQRVLIILVVALGLAAVAWFVAENYGQAIDQTPAAGTSEAPASATQVTPSNQPVIDNTPADGQPAQTAPALADPTPDASTGVTTAPPAANQN